jgi:agmatine/peptidylarginine deiminase
MLVQQPGVRYLVEGFVDKNETQTVHFIEKISKKEYVLKLKEQGLSDEEIDNHLKDIKAYALPDSSLILVQDGTTNEDLIDVLVHRLKFLQTKSFCEENRNAIIKLEESKLWLQKRTQEKRNNKVNRS